MHPPAFSGKVVDILKPGFSAFLFFGLNKPKRIKPKKEYFKSKVVDSNPLNPLQ